MIATMRMTAKAIPMPTLATGEREVCWEGEVVGVAVVVEKVEDDGVAERG